MRIKAYILPVLMVFGMIAGSQAQSPTRWRGPEENGIYPDRDLAGQWPSLIRDWKVVSSGTAGTQAEYRYPADFTWRWPRRMRVR